MCGYYGFKYTIFFIVFTAKNYDFLILSIYPTPSSPNKLKPLFLSHY